MRSPITKLTAAAIVVVALLSITFYYKVATPAYALEQTVEANHTIETIHLRISRDAQSGEYVDCWVKYDQAGLVSNFRQNFYEDVTKDDDNLKFLVWNNGVLKTWLPLKKVVIVIRYNNVETYWQDFANDFDPRLILQRLYDLEKQQAIELKIDEPAADGESIRVEAISPADKTRVELVVDPETKLVKRFSEYSLEEEDDGLEIRIDFLAYNQPIDPSVFTLSGIPDDAHVYDQIDRFVGLEKGDLTNDEIAVKVVLAALEATIAGDYDEVSRLMEGDPGDTIEVFLEEELGARLSGVVSLGQPKPHERWPFILCVPCEIEVENAEGDKRIANITATAKPIGYQPGCRWIMHTDLEVDAQNPTVNGTITSGLGVGDYTLEMSKDEVLKSLGEPKKIFIGQEKYTLANLPREYFMVFGDISFLIVDDSVKGITVHSPSCKLNNGLGVGDSEDDIIQAFGDGFRLHESQWKDYLRYEDKGLGFEIHKQNRTVLEINVFSPDM
ncbi:MAG: LolA family protein [Planctomycetota bacterium]